MYNGAFFWVFVFLIFYYVINRCSTPTFVVAHISILIFFNMMNSKEWSNNTMGIKIYNQREKICSKYRPQNESY